ncbi:MAG: glycosyltransferase family 2 protein, partial [Acidimicrobiales bacterium]
VSVIIPTFNRASLVQRAVRSALAAARPGDEVIVVDDGSTDGTEAALAGIDERVRFLRAHHGGAGRARNLGVRAARHPLVAFLDSDDEWTADKLELQRTVMQERPDVLFCFTDFAVRHEGEPDRHGYLAHWHGDERGWDAILGPSVAYSSLAPPPPGREDLDVYVGDLYPEVLSGHFVPTFTLMVRREAAGSALWFADDLPTYEDLECHARLAGAGLAAYLDCETAYQWGHGGPRLTDADRYACASARLTIVERVYGRDPAFLKSFRDRYDREVRRQHLVRFRCLLAEGRSSEARRDLRLAGRAPLRYRVVASLPPWLTGPGARTCRSAVRHARSLRHRP